MQYGEFKNSDVKNAYDSYCPEVRGRLLQLREIIFQTAEKCSEIGVLEETLKWGNPSYLTHKPKSGTTVRLSELSADQRKYAISVHCQTTLISEFKQAYPQLEYDGNRSIVLNVDQPIPTQIMRHFILLALTYHSRKTL